MKLTAATPAEPDASRSVTVSIVSHGQQALAKNLLLQLNEHSHASIRKVILTVNIPEDDGLEGLEWRFPLERIVNTAPQGFGANHNRAFRRCESEWFLVINPDVELFSDVIGELLRRAQDSTGLLAPQEVDAKGKLVQNLRGLITPWELLQRQLLQHERPPPRQSGWVKGMFMLVRSQAYRRLQGFDERYFMYCEDFDLCARLMQQGWTVDHHADLSVRHAWQRQSHGSTSHLKHHSRSLFRLWTSRAFWHYRSMVKNTPHND